MKFPKKYQKTENILNQKFKYRQSLDKGLPMLYLCISKNFKPQTTVCSKQKNKIRKFYENI
ncbi:MAG: hypothetical protein DI529_09595 [Chryseobacterium sp.]|nr:MAG: hypothetical protein DI529_09595 [Chryseobacterium sp.]